MPFFVFLFIDRCFTGHILITPTSLKAPNFTSTQPTQTTTLIKPPPQVMELEARLQKAAADFAQQQDESQKSAAASAAAGGPRPDANGIDVSSIGRMGKGASVALQQLAAQGPGMARMMAEAANSYLQPGAGGAAGAGAGAGSGGLRGLCVF